MSQTQSLDSDGEAALLSSIEQLRHGGSTVVLITHKTSILAVVDKVLVLAHGQIAGFGSRDEVLSRLLNPRLTSVPTAVVSA